MDIIKINYNDSKAVGINPFYKDGKNKTSNDDEHKKALLEILSLTFNIPKNSDNYKKLKESVKSYFIDVKENHNIYDFVDYAKSKNDLSLTKVQ